MSKPFSKMPETYRKRFKETVLFCIVTGNGRKSEIWRQVVKYKNDFKPTTKQLDEVLNSFLSMNLIQYLEYEKVYALVG